MDVLNFSSEFIFEMEKWLFEFFDVIFLMTASFRLIGFGKL